MKSTALYFLLLCFLFCGCSKGRTDTTPTYPIEGTWVGTYKYDPGVSSVTAEQYFSFVIKPNGQILVESKDAGVTYNAVGTWTLNGSAFTANYTYSNSVNGVQLQQTSTAVFESSGKLSGGKWFNTNNVSQKGTFSMSRVN